MTTRTATLAEFVLARIGEAYEKARHDQADAMVGLRWKHFPEDAYNEIQATVLADTRRVLAQCAAHRAIVESVERALPRGTGGLGPSVLFALAAIWSDAPGYRSEWAL